MEASAAMKLTVEIYEKSNQKVFIEFIVSDDNSTMRGVLKYPKMKKTHRMKL